MKKSITLLNLALFLLSGTLNSQVSYLIKSIDQETGKVAPEEYTVRADDIDLQVNDFYAIPPNVWWPASQGECFGFMADIQNNSSNAATGVILNLSIVDNQTSQTVYSEDLTYNTVPGGVFVDNIPFAGCYTPPNIITDYTGTYTISSDSLDNNSSNNSQTFHFEMTENIFSKESGPTSTVTPQIDDLPTQTWAWGCYYYIAGGSPFFAAEASFAVGNAADVAERILTISLYEWTEDTNMDEKIDPDERVRVGFNVYQVDGTEGPADIITVPILNYPSGSGSVELKNETEYILMLEYVTIDNVKLFMSASNQYDYTAQFFLSTLNNNVPRYAAILGIGSDLESTSFETIGFGLDIVPVARLAITSTVDNLDNRFEEAHKIELSPNPAKEVLNIDLDLAESPARAGLRITDINGRVLLQKTIRNVQESALSFDIGHLAPGMYVFRFDSALGSYTKRFVKID